MLSRRQIKDAIFGVATILVIGLAHVAESYIEKPARRPEYRCRPREDWYGLAAETISESTMWSEDKVKALRRESAKFADVFEIG